MGLTFPEAFNEDILPGDAVFLFRHMPNAHLQFCLACLIGPRWVVRLEC
jgi:hypothetical protein